MARAALQSHPVPRRELPPVVAAVDLGSNSFHLVVARLAHGKLDVVDRLREPVRLAAGLDEEGRLRGDARRRALGCLRRFGQRLRDMPPGTVRAVGTNALRRATDARAFLHEATHALGHPIEVIAGTEEARLIYLGVAHDLHQGSERRLVVDIGGGSTELIVGAGLEPQDARSLYMGCVSWSERFFPNGRLSEKAFQRAVLAARVELEPLERRFSELASAQAVGASGTILAAEAVLRDRGWTESGIPREALETLCREMAGAGRVRDLKLPGLGAHRAPVLPGGLAILLATFEGLGIETMRTSQGALREGLLHDLLGRMGEEDARDRTISGFVQRYQVDQEQARRVERTVLRLLEQVAAEWHLEDDAAAKVLSWAARLHEIGLAVSHAGSHKHGAYLVGNADMPGFSRDDQELLATLIRFHRRKLPRSGLPAAPPNLRPKSSLRLCALLRLAVLLNRSRMQGELPVPRVTARKTALDVAFPNGWLDEHPLTRADLDAEIGYLATAGLRLTVHQRATR